MISVTLIKAKLSVFPEIEYVTEALPEAAPGSDPPQAEDDTMVCPPMVQETLVVMGSAFADNTKMPRKVKRMADFKEMAPVLSLFGFFDSVI